MSDRMTNVEFVTDLMEFSRNGALMQVFIIDAIGKHARRLAAATPEAVDHPLIHGASWIATAQEVVQRLEEQYGTATPGATQPQKVQLFAAFLEADEVVIDGYEVEEFHLTPSARVKQPYVWTAAELAIELDDQQIVLADDDDASKATFVDLRGEQHSLVLHQVVRRPLQFPLGE